MVHQYRYKLRTVSLCCFAYEWKIHKNLCCQCIWLTSNSLHLLNIRIIFVKLLKIDSKFILKEKKSNFRIKRNFEEEETDLKRHFKEKRTDVKKTTVGKKTLKQNIFGK